MFWLIVALLVLLLIVILLVGILANFGAEVNRQKGVISRLETSNKKWMESADSFRKSGEEVQTLLQESYDKMVDVVEERDKVKEELSKERSRNKSVEVRTGQIMEKMAPFFEVFDHDPKNAQFLGNPIDYVIFNEDEIVFLEVKTGKARTTKKQNGIKKLIEEGKVRFELVRFDYE